MWLKKRFYLFSFFLIGTIFITCQYFDLGMMALTGFLVAFLSKGMRNTSVKNDSDSKISKSISGE